MLCLLCDYAPPGSGEREFTAKPYSVEHIQMRWSVLWLYFVPNNADLMSGSARLSYLYVFK